MKDSSIIKLTNHVHELELSSAALVSHANAGGTVALSATNSGGNSSDGYSPKLTSNGISFDSDRFEFKEFVDVGVQCTELAAVVVDKEKEDLLDAVKAYEMQNKFLNKEVLELNQLRQQAADREQKLFM